MEVKQTKSFEISQEEIVKLIRQGLRINPKDEVKFSKQIPKGLKLTIISREVTDLPPLKTTRGGVKEQNVSTQPENQDQIIAEIPQIQEGQQCCGNCSYPYPVGDNMLFCDLLDQNITYDFGKDCKEFSPKMEEPKR